MDIRPEQHKGIRRVSFGARAAQEEAAITEHKSTEKRQLDG